MGIGFKSKRLVIGVPFLLGRNLLFSAALFFIFGGPSCFFFLFSFLASLGGGFLLLLCQNPKLI